MTEWESGVAFRELLDLLRDADRTFLEGDRAVTDEVSAAEGYRFLTDALHAALEIYLRSDAQRPRSCRSRARRSSGAATTATRSTTSRRSRRISSTA